MILVLIFSIDLLNFHNIFIMSSASKRFRLILGNMDEESGNYCLF